MLYNTITSTVDRDMHSTLDATITKQELETAITRSAVRKAPGEDGLTAELYRWGKDIMQTELLEMYNEMFQNGQMTPQMTQGIIVCIPKNTTPKYVRDYRPLTLLNADYKIYTRIIAHRMQQTLHKVIHKTQHSGIPGRSIVDAAAGLRDITAIGARRRNGICLITLDFQGAFDNISHEYLTNLLERYGYSTGIRRAIHSLYATAQSKLAINGHLTKNINIQCSVRQGCPLSTILYALALNPFLISIDQQLQGIRIGKNNHKVTSIAYADDVTVILQDHNEITQLQKIITTYETATGAKIHWEKTKCIPIGHWDQNKPVGQLTYANKAKILGIEFHNTMEQTIERTWNDVIQKLHGSIKDIYTRKLDIIQRMKISNTYLLSKIWYIAQLLPLTARQAQHITTIILGQLWKGWIFRVPVSTLYNRTSEGGINMVDVRAKCATLYFMRMEQQRHIQELPTAQWLRTLYATIQWKNPPNMAYLPKELEYLTHYIHEWAYIGEKRNTETTKSYKRRIYETNRQKDKAANPPREMRITRKYPNINWQIVWKNIHMPFLPHKVRAAWFTMVHDIIPTNERLHTINLHPDERCKICQERDTLIHRLTGCKETKKIWNWTQNRIAWYLRTNPKEVQEKWVTFPDYTLWPRQRHNATTWILGHMMWYVTANMTTPTLMDYMDYMKRTRWKVHNQRHHKQHCGNYLQILDY